MPESSLQAASDCNMWQFSIGLSTIGLLRGESAAGSWAFNHSLAEATALEIISSGEAVFLLNKRLLRAIQSDHNSHGVSTTDERPIGGGKSVPSGSSNSQESLSICYPQRLG